MTTFTFGGDREQVDADRAKVLCAESAPDDPLSVTKVCLSNKSYDEDAASVIAEQLKQFRHLKQVDISDVIAGRPENVGFGVLTLLTDALRDLTEIEEVNLSDNALGLRGVNHCLGAFENKQLRHLYLCNNGLASEAVVRVCEILPPTTQLQTLHLHSNMCGDPGAKAFAELISTRCPHLTNIRFSSNRALTEGSLDLANGLRTLVAAGHTGITHLDLSDNTFKTEGGEILAETLKLLPNLRYLHLRDAGLEDEGCAAVLGGLIEGGAQELRELNFSGNDLTEEIAEPLAALMVKGKLERLVLDENTLASSGAVAITKAVGAHQTAGPACPSLIHLSLGMNEMGARGARAVARFVIAHCPALTSLRLDENEIAEAGVEDVQQTLERGGKEGVLGSMEENDEEAEDDEGEGQEQSGGEEAEDSKEDKDVDALADTFAKKL